MPPFLVKTRDTLIPYILWLFLSILATVTAQKSYQLLMLLSHYWLTSSWRPLSWNQATLTGLSRFYLLLLGILWLAYVMLAEQYLQRGRQTQQLQSHFRHLFLPNILLYVTSYLTFWLLS
ncbi:MAG TPA: hypothetical protein VLL52_02090 [Anaerolineae bacterium]|nr:hypothetical protein [Anaerolineae bacterium]